MLTRMGDSLIDDCGDDVFVEARASQHHTQRLIMTTINTDYSNNEYGNEFTADKLTELSEDDLEGVAGGTGIDWIDPKTHTPWFL